MMIDRVHDLQKLQQLLAEVMNAINTIIAMDETPEDSKGVFYSVKRAELLIRAIDLLEVLEKTEND